MARIEAEGRHPRLLMHACCAPCSAFPLEFLSGVFEVTIYYNNSNIYPAAEYQKVNLVVSKDRERFFAGFKVLLSEGYLKVAGKPSDRGVAGKTVDKPSDTSVEESEKIDLGFLELLITL